MRFGYLNTIWLLAFLLLSLLAAAQQINRCLEIEWAYNFGGSDKEWIRAVAQAPDGGFIFAGYSRSDDGQLSGNSGDWDVWVVKVDNEGQMEWDGVFGGSGSDEVSALQPTTDGGYILAGSSTSTDGNLTGNNGNEDAWILKLSAQGDLLWQRNFGGTKADKAEAIRQTTDGDYIVAGYSESNDGDVGANNGDFDVWAFKIDDSGNLLWSENFGGGLDDWAFALDLSTDGGYVLAGSSFSSDGDLTNNNGFYDFWIIKIDASGSLQWQRSMGGTSDERAYAVAQTADGGYIAAGVAFSSGGDVSANNGGSDIWLVKVDAAGNLLWDRNYGGSGEEYARALQVRPDGGFAILGYTYSDEGDVSNNNGFYDYWLLETDDSGNLLWQHTYGGSGSERAYALDLTDDGGYLLGGYALSNDGDVIDNFGDWDSWLVKLHYDPIELDLGMDTLLCTGQQTRLDASMADASQFVWMDGNSGPFYQVTTPGLYWVEASRTECLARDSIIVDYTSADVLDLGGSILKCASSGAVTLDATLPDADAYLWQDGSNSPVFIAGQTALYSVEVMQYGCSVKDSVLVTFSAPFAELGRDTVICEGDYLIPEMWQPGGTYLWQDGWTGHNYLLRDTGTYWVEVNVDGCIARDTFHVRFCEKFRDPCLEFPNAFTPNGDAINEFFKPVNFCRADSYQLQIFNRWGELLFAGNDPESGWNGSYKGAISKPGVYVYVAELKFTVEGKQLQQVSRGELLLIR